MISDSVSSTCGSPDHLRKRRESQPTPMPKAISLATMRRKFAGGERQREMPDHDGGQREAVEDQRCGIIGKPLTLEDDQEPPRHVEPARDRERRHHVGRRDDGAEQEADGPGQADHIVRGGRHHRCGEDHGSDREQHDGTQIVLELTPAHGNARRVDQRRQHHQQHQFRRQFHRGHARHEGEADARQHQQDGGGDVEAACGQRHACQYGEQDEKGLKLRFHDGLS
ncbi:hypothetical protein ABIG07_002979 [Bradyrhizobium ottawaense]|uniref:Uncharacterized protein n=1 Tax=Bradyrhizobium ottawaense TaxID=931866 RepID=A0ABV4FR11_9BRAD